MFARVLSRMSLPRLELFFKNCIVLPNIFALITLLILFTNILKAAVSDVIIWDGVRTESQMLDTLNNGYSSTTGMRLWWDFSNVNNLGYDVTGNGYNGITKGVVCGLNMTDQFSNSRTVATGFNHESCYIVGNPGFTNASIADRTYELWIKNPSKSDSVFFSLTQTETGGGNDLKRIWISSDGSMTIADMGYYTPNFQSFTSSPLTWTNDQWYQIVVVFDYTGNDRHNVRVYRGVRPGSLTKLFDYTGSSLGSNHWLAIGGHEQGYYSTGVGKAGFLGCDGPGSSPVIKPEDFGAVGNGTSDDTDAWRKACAVLSAYGKGTLELTNGKTYKIGQETVDSDPDIPYYQAASLGIILGAKEGKITVNGNSAVVKLADSMHFGAFYSDTGAAYPQKTLNELYAACPGNLLTIEACAEVEVKDIKFDGNITNQIWGGEWTVDLGIQLPQSGLNLKNNDSVYVHDIESSNNGLDGIDIVNNVDQTAELKTVLVENVKCLYNGRQGLSYNCGNHLEVYNSEFSHTGRIKTNSPACGIDVEPMGRYMAQGAVFDNCKFFDNEAYGVLLAGAPAVIIRDSLIWGTTSYAATIQLPDDDQDNLFVNCTIYGGVYNRGERTRLESCSILNPSSAYYSSSYPDAAVANKIAIEQNDGSVIASGCNIQAMQTAYSLWISDAVLQACTITHGNYRGDGTYSVSVINSSYILNTSFNETNIFGSYPNLNYPHYINDYSGTAQIGTSVSIEGATTGSDHYISWSTSFGTRPLSAQTLTSNINDGVLTPNADTGETQINTGATYTALPAFNNPTDSTGARLFDKDLPYDDWSNCCGLNYNDQTVTVDLKSTRSIRQVKLRMKHSQKPKRIYVYVGDGTNWTKIGLIRPLESYFSAPWYDVVSCFPISGRYVKIEFENDGEWGWYINEVKIYGY